ncbi:MAG: tetratricopeptide repeat protein [Magnetococcales bacterium]|nr:tetratricopeptide repeat protein [Magnetococcales bacterium]
MSRKRVMQQQKGNRPPLGRQEELFAREKGFALYGAGHIAESLAVTVEALRYTTSPDILLDLLKLAAVCHMRLGQTVQAESCWRRALRLQPDCADLHNDLGNLLQGSHRPAEAEAAYRAALRLQPDHADGHYNLGLLLQGQHRFTEAEAAYRQALHLRPKHAETAHNLGNLLQGLHRFEEAEMAYRLALHLRPHHAGTCYNLGHLLHAWHRFEEAEAAYRQTIHLQPNHVDGHHNLGWLLHSQHRLTEAEAAYRQVLLLQPNHAGAYNNLGTLLQEQHRLTEAEVAYRAALRIQPDHAEAYNNLGNLLHGQHRLAEAEAAYRASLRLRPNHAATHNNLGLLLQTQHRLAEAEAAYQQALARQPDHAEARNNLGNLLHEWHREAEAEAAYRQVLQLHPDHVDAHYNLGNLLQQHNRLTEAETIYRQALSRQPDHANLHYNLALLLAAQLRLAESATSHQWALHYQPEHAMARWSLAFIRLLSSWDGPEARCAVREGFHQDLLLLEQWFAERQWRFGPQAVGSMQPFFLAYHAADNRALLTGYGDLCARLMAVWYAGESWSVPVARPVTQPVLAPAESAVCPSSAGQTRPIRVGVVSKYFYDHSVWNALVKGWFRHFDPRRFQMMAFGTSGISDAETECAKTLSDFTSGPLSLTEWVECLLAARLDVLIYPEVGMDGMTVKLASLRLAPVQMAAWGHPETTGLPTIDWYLSAELFEAAHSARYYREQLLPLPNLGTCCSRMTTANQAPLDLTRFGLCAERPILICAGTPFKYDPDQDAVFVALIEKIAGCQLVFFDYPKYNAIFQVLRARLEKRVAPWAAADTPPLIFLPWLSMADFHGLLRGATLLLDPIGFSGFNTVLQAVECGLPVVTLEGPFLRGRLGAGILRRLGLADSIAQNVEAYVDLAVRFSTDAGFRRTMQARQSAALPNLFEDRAPIEALQDRLEEIVRGNPRSP